MTKQEKIDAFDPNGVGLNNGNFIGLPFNEKDAEIVLLPVPWDVTVSFAEGTASGPDNILESSYQLDLGDLFAPEVWKRGIFFKKKSKKIAKRGKKLRKSVRKYIDFLENGGDVTRDTEMMNIQAEVLLASLELKDYVKKKTTALLKKGKKIGLLGGEHSVPLGYLETLAAHYGNFGILQIDAHADLRRAYEGFTYSHASIFYNALKIKEVTKLTQVGIRDFCEEELEVMRGENGRVVTFFDQNMKEQLFNGTTWAAICARIVESLPQRVYVSFDIDGLSPDLCPNTGTPVPGGLSFDEATFLLRQVKLSGREIIGFDLSETAAAGHDWDGNVAARMVYRLCGVL